MPKTLSITKEIFPIIEGRRHTVQLSVEYEEADRVTSQSRDWYWISAVCEDGFDLCGRDAYCRDTLPASKRIKLERSRIEAMALILDQYESVLMQNVKVLGLSIITHGYRSLCVQTY
jgi:hypothetical protein